MMKLVTKLSAGLAMAAIAFTSASAQPAAVKVSDLNLSDPAQVQKLNSRITNAAHEFCIDADMSRDLTRMADCESSVRAEVMEKLEAQLASAKRPVSLASR